MEVVNATRMQAGYTMGLEPSGRELLVVVIKGTFVLPKNGESVRLHDEQLPLVMADTFTGQPGFSAPMYEVDFVPRKPACDVLLLGSAYAPEGRPTTRVEVGLRVGGMSKTFAVVGDRFWDAGVTGIRATPPRAFVQKSISYDFAFGGVDQESENPAEHDAYLPNPVGRGFRKHLRNAWVEGRPLPNSEEIGQPVTWPAHHYKPVAFGPVGRVWSARARHAGTYDQEWLDQVFPFLPKDFDERYYQAAPDDQRVPLPDAPLQVCLTNLTADGTRTFVLPHFDAPVHIFPRRGPREDLKAKLDTIVIEPDMGRLTMSWRVARALQKNIFEIAQLTIGRKSAAWLRAKEAGKPYVNSISNAAAVIAREDA